MVATGLVATVRNHQIIQLWMLDASVWVHASKQHPLQLPGHAATQKPSI